MSKENEADHHQKSCATCGMTDHTEDDCTCDVMEYCMNRYKDLFTQPCDESHLGECPICCLPLPSDAKKLTLMPCCGKTICNGCNYANRKREIGAGLEQKCAFCREPWSKSKEEFYKNVKKKVKKKCPVAMCQMGFMLSNEGDYETAVELMRVRIIICLFCIVQGKVLRRT